MVCSTCVLNSCLIQSVSKMTVFSLCNQWVYTLDFIKKKPTLLVFLILARDLQQQVQNLDIITKESVLTKDKQRLH